MLARSFWVSLMVLLLPLPARAQLLTESEVIRMARERDPVVAAASHSVLVAAANELAPGLLPNPELEYEREHFPGAQAEDRLALSLPVDLSGARRARGAMARADTAEARSLAALSQSQVVAAALQVFYEALAADQLVRVEQTGVKRLETAARVLERRRAEGAVSGYDEHRLGIELELSRSQLAGAKARAALLRQELGIRLGLSSGIGLRGTLDAAPAARQADFADETVVRPSTRHVRRSVSELSTARDESQSAWVPTVSLRGGVLRQQADPSRYGYVAGVAVSLPIFARGQDLRAETDARLRLAQAKVVARERSVRLEVARARVQLQYAERELDRFRSSTSARVERLERAASSAYQEGRRSILELVDAQRVRSTVEKRALELALTVKRAEIALRAARGEFE